jgi:metacaspase-1
MPLKVLCIHGFDGHSPSGVCEEGEWTNPLRESLGSDIQVSFCHLDAPFGGGDFSAEQAHAAACLVQGLRRPDEARNDAASLPDRTLALLGRWLSEPACRKRLRQHLAQCIAREKPQLVLAHSVGSLVAFDCFNEPETAACAQGLHLVALGTQLGNRAVWPCFGGRLEMPVALLRFTQLYRADDPVFTEPIPLTDTRFARLTVDDGRWLPWRHPLAHYLPSLSLVLEHWGSWLPTARQARGLKQRLTVAADAPRKRLHATERAPRRRALLVGINEYADPGTAELRGCVNDAWLMSSLLQESGFDASEIRMVLNQRATAQGLQERLDWLVDDAREGDTCVFFYSGHGAQLPLYGPDGQHVVGVHESLVPHDFDWSAGRAVTDEQFSAFYSQLPYGLNFLAIFDCCHSGGMTRASGNQRIRGLEPPDDIRHRMLRWLPERQMWAPRDFKSPNAEYARKLGSGSSPVQALGQSLALRGEQGVKGLRKLAARYGHWGPYMPTLLYACADREFSYEYEHGPIAYGAYTYSLVKTLRAARSSKGLPSFESLVQEVRAELKALGFAQTPRLAAPSHVKVMPVPLSA